VTVTVSRLETANAAMPFPVHQVKNVPLPPCCSCRSLFENAPTCLAPLSPSGRIEFSGTFAEVDAVLLPGQVCGKAYVMQAHFEGLTDVNDLTTVVKGTLQYVAGFIDKDGQVVCGSFSSPLSFTFACSSEQLPVVECGQLQLYLDP
jgi:hypothetical protein